MSKARIVLKIFVPSIDKRSEDYFMVSIKLGFKTAKDTYSVSTSATVDY